MKNKQKTIVMDLGGSIVIPEPGKIDTTFLKDFQEFIIRMIHDGFKFILIVGGGKTARIYQQAARELGIISYDDIDAIGIHATHINACVIRSLFDEYAFPSIIDNFNKKINGDWKMIVASGTKPGWSTDYVSVRLAKKFGVKKVFIASNITNVYTDDIKINPSAKPINKIAWSNYRKIISELWTPGMPSPVDPVAAKFAQKNGIEAIVLRGTNLANLKKAILEKEFIGTLIY